MKLPISMIRAMVETKLSPEEIGDLLTMAGFELEGIEGDVLDLKVMANRGDGLSALGMAREILAKDAGAQATDLYKRAVGRFGDVVLGDAEGVATVSIETPDCNRFAVRMFRDVRNGASPDWLRDALTQAGVRPISLIVDLTNYVMLELGQPMHAFDHDKLTEGRIVVRQARAGEKLATLDGIQHELNSEQMMVCDAVRPVGAAGIMGGADTEVSASTRNVLLESAHFLNSSVRRTRKQFGLNTEASYRFERSVDPEGVVAALNRFAELYAEIAGPEGIVAGVIDVYPNPPAVRSIPVRVSRGNHLLGMEISPEQAKAYLTALGFEVSGSGEPFTVKVPTWRPDVLREEDVIEELGRVHGYEKIPETLPQGTTPRGGVFGPLKLIEDAREIALRCGLQEVVSHSLRDAHPLDFTPDWRVEVRNPHSPEMRLLRDSLLPGLAEAAHRNGGRDLHLFEIGKVFVRGEYQFDESPELAILSTGKLEAPHWVGGANADADFYSLKGTIEQLLASLGLHAEYLPPNDPDRRLHPTRQAGVLLDGGKLWAGFVGQIHPDIAEEIGLPSATFVAEIDLLVLATESAIEPRLKELSRNPAVRRDIAILVEKAVPYRDIAERIESACGAILERHWLFDIYEGDNLPAGHHSLTIALQLRKMGENLTDDEANQVRDRAVEALAALGAKQR